MSVTNNHKSVCHVQYGSIYSNSDAIIENPAVVLSFDPNVTTLLYWGDLPNVQAKFDNLIKRYSAAKMPTDNILLVELNHPQMSREEQCYILRRCIEYTASHFQVKFSSILLGLDKTDLLKWLREEMAKVPIDVYS